MNIKLGKKQVKISYHWVIFIIGFLTVCIALGFGSSTRGTYKAAILENDDSLNFEYFYYSFTDTFRYVTTAVLNLFFGFFVVKLGARKLAGLGFLSLTLSCLLCSVGTQYWHFYLGASLLGVGFAWTSSSLVGYIVEKWFTNGKGTIMGIMLAANGLGGTISEMLINPMALKEGGLGWRAAYQITAILYLVMAVVVVLFLRNQPSDCGLEPLGQDKVAKKKRGADWVGFEFRQVLRKKYFYVAAVCIFLTGMILQSMHGLSKTHMYNILGRSDSVVDWITLVYMVHSLTLLCSKILSGIVFDRFGIRISFGYCSIFAVVALSALSLMSPESTVCGWFYAVCSALALPLETVMIPLLVSEMFGKAAHAKIMGIYLGINVFGFACGGPLADFVKERSDGYAGLLLSFAAIMLAVTVVTQIIFIVSKKDRERFLQTLAQNQE